MRPADVVQHFDNIRRTKRGWSARCSAHDDRTNSLALVIGDNGGLLAYCHAGCRFDEIARSVGLTPRDFFGDNRDESRPRGRHPAARPLSLLEQARRDVIRAAHRQLARLPLDAYREADERRWCFQLIRRARQMATVLGPDNSSAWHLAELAADLERSVAEPVT